MANSTPVTLTQFPNIPDEGTSAPLVFPQPRRTDQPRLIHTPQPRGTDQARRTYTPMKRGQVVSPGTVLAVIAVIGITVGLALLAAHTGSGWVHYAAQAGAVVSGVFAVSSVVLAIIFCFKKHITNQQHERRRPELYRPREIVALPQRGNRQPVVRAPGDHSAQWTERLKGASKCQANGDLYAEDNDAAPCYYDLTHDASNVGARKPFAGELDLGDTGKFLEIPHFGQYPTVYRPDDHLMAVRLPESQLATFPQSIQHELANEEHPELYFMVFKTPAEARGFSRNISMHAMALPNYDRTVPNGNIREGQKAMQIPSGGIGLETPMKIVACGREGITVDNQGPNALTNHPKNVKVSIHTPIWPNPNNQHEFSNNHAHFQVNENTDVSHMYVLAKMPGRAVAFQAVILNNAEGNHGGIALSLATQQNSLGGFLNIINEDKTLHVSIKEKIKRTFIHPSGLQNNPPIRRDNRNDRFTGSAENRLGGAPPTANPTQTDTKNTMEAID